MTNYLKRALQSVAERAGRRTVEQLTQSGFADETAFRAASETILLNLKDGETPRDRFHAVSDGFWYWLLTEGCRRNRAISKFLPGLPAEELQLRYTGDAGDATLNEGWQAWRLFRDLYETHRGPLNDQVKVLDYGCGWGRIIRFFLKDVPSAVGADPAEEVLKCAVETNRWCTFEKIPFTPPSQLPEASYDLIYSFSVFSHLSEERHHLVRDDLMRLLKPGGLMMVTTRTRAFIDYCAKLRADQQHAGQKPGHTSSAVAFPDIDTAKAQYDRGGYVFHSFAQNGDWSHWGEAAVPQSYVQREWTKQLQFVDFVNDPARLSQAVIVMRKSV